MAAFKNLSKNVVLWTNSWGPPKKVASMYYGKFRKYDVHKTKQWGANKAFCLQVFLFAKERISLSHVLPSAGMTEVLWPFFGCKHEPVTELEGLCLGGWYHQMVDCMLRDSSYPLSRAISSILTCNILRTKKSWKLTGPDQHVFASIFTMSRNSLSIFVNLSIDFLNRCNPFS